MSSFRNRDGLTLAYREAGTGRPLLCLSGLNRSGRDFDYLAAHLRDVRLIMPDYRGRGESDWADPSSYIPTREAEDAIELLDRLEIGSVPVLGTSRGGIVAMAMAARDGERISGAILNDIGPVVEKAGLERIVQNIGRRPAVRTMAQAAAVLAENSPGFANVPEQRWAEEAKRCYKEAESRLEIAYDPQLRSAFLASYSGEPLRIWRQFDALRDIPVAVLRGAGSDFLSRETLAAMRERRPDLAATEIPDRGHCPFLDEPESLAAIRAFLSRIA